MTKNQQFEALTGPLALNGKKQKKSLFPLFIQFFSIFPYRLFDFAQGLG